MDKTTSRQTKVKRLTEDLKQKTLASNVSAHRIPQMSETALKRWNEARDTYLGGRCPQAPKLRRVKPRSIREPVPITILEPDLLSKTEPQHQPPLEETEIIHEPVDIKCVGTETDESTLINTEIEQIDEAIQADLPSPPPELQSELDPNTIKKEQKEEIQSYHESVEYDDKATETELIFDINQEDEVDRQSPKETTIETIPNIEDTIEPIPNIDDTIEQIPNIEDTIEPANDAETKAILPSSKSELSVHEQLRRYARATFSFI